MASVKTEHLKTIDTDTSNTSTNTSNEKMTVDKQSGHLPTASKDRTTIKNSSNEAPTVPPAHLKVASGNNVPTSPKKNDVKNSPTSKDPTSIQSKPQSQQQQQQQQKSKVNPWHKNPSPTSSSGGTKKAVNVPPEGGNKVGIDSPTKDDSSSKSIRIPRDEVWLCMWCVLVVLVRRTSNFPADVYIE